MTLDSGSVTLMRIFAVVLKIYGETGLQKRHFVSFTERVKDDKSGKDDNNARMRNLLGILGVQNKYRTVFSSN